MTRFLFSTLCLASRRLINEGLLFGQVRLGGIKLFLGFRRLGSKRVRAVFKRDNPRLIPQRL